MVASVECKRDVLFHNLVHASKQVFRIGIRRARKNNYWLVKIEISAESGIGGAYGIKCVVFHWLLALSLETSSSNVSE